MKLLSLTEWGNPILARPAKNVSVAFLKTVRFKNLAKNMIYTMRRTHGVGLAANQVGVALKIAVIETRPTPTRPKLARRGPIIVINPKIIKYSKNQIGDWEGCLSFPGVRGRVPRAKEITVTYQNEKGQKITKKATGLWARIFQHEIDHLNGIGYAERMKDMKTLVTIDEFKKRYVRIS